MMEKRNKRKFNKIKEVRTEEPLFFPSSPFQIIVLTARGLEDILKEEVLEILSREGISPSTSVSVRAGSVQLSGGWREIVALNLTLRTASRVLILVARARARKLDDIYHAASQIPWEEFFDVDKTFSVTSGVSDSK